MSPLSGSFASWYYRFPYNQETNPTKDAFRRAITTSFGSVCMGSLVVAVVRTLRTMVSMAHKGVQNRNTMLAAVFSRILMCLERLTQYFNVYAFVHVAVYGRSYVEAAKVASDIVRSSATT